jgi:non-specific protein-tyrosine kinase
MELRPHLLAARRWLWLVVLGTLLAAGAGYLVTRSLPRIYQATATVVVGGSLRSVSPTGNELFVTERLALTYGELAKRPSVLQATIAALGLDSSPEALAGNVSANVIKDTQLIEIKVTDRVPASAQQIANEIANQLRLQTPGETDRSANQRREFVNRELDDLQGTIDQLQGEISRLSREADATSDPLRKASLLTDQRQARDRLAAARSSYTSLLSSYTGGASNIPNTLTLVEPARLPTAPISPNVPASVALAALLGLLVTLSAALLIEYFDDSIRDPERLQEATSLLLLGMIGHFGDRLKQIRTTSALRTQGPHAEAFRSLRTQLQFLSLDTPLRSLLVTSPRPRDGKTTTAANLGAITAQAGLRVVVVETDLRRPSIHEEFGVPNTRGLSTLLLESDPDPIPYLLECGIENLQVLPSGPLPPNPAELLGHARMQRVLERLREHVDLAILDAPPALQVTDAAVVARHVDGVLLVARYGATGLGALTRARDELTRVGARVLGVVLNAAPTASGYYGYGYYTSGAERTSSPHRLGWVGQRLRWLVPGPRRA